MIIGSTSQGTVRDNINRLKGEKVDTNEILGSKYRNEEYKAQVEKVDMNKIDPDDRDVDDSEKEWKDFY